MTAAAPALQRLVSTLGGGVLGRTVAAVGVCWSAPYFATIRPRFLVLEPGRVVAQVRKRRAVTNHLGTVHAIALCNAAELVGGTCMELSTPPHLRWIPVGMTVAYERLAKTDVVATATLPAGHTWAPGDVGLPVVVVDRDGVQVFSATIQMRVSERPSAAR